MHSIIGNMRDFHTEKQIQARLHRDDCEIFCYTQISSTNALAKEKLPAQRKAFAIYIAKRQTQGRGRRGRTFFSPRGGIYLSLAISKTLLAETEERLTCSAAVAVSSAVETVCGFLPGIKWVNDLLLPNGKKFCGILCEKTEDGVVMGVGVNAGRSAFPQNLREVADTLRLSQRQKKQLILEIIQSLIEIITFSSPNIMEKYREQNVLLNKEIIYHKNGSEKFARVEGIDDRGALLVRFENGESTCLLSGEVSVRKCER